MDTLIEITKGVLEGRLSPILPTTAGGRAPLRIRVVRPVPIELRLALVEPQVRDLVVAVARAPTGITASHPCHRRSSFTSRWKRTYKLSLLNLIRRQAELELKPPALGNSK